MKRVCLLFLMIVCVASTAYADSVDVILGAGTTGALKAGPDVVETVGGTFIFNLAPGVASTETFYVPTYEALCVLCSGTVTGTLTSPTLNVVDTTVAGTGSGSFSQQFSDAGAGSGPTASDVFTPLLSSATSIALTNGDTLFITPLAGSAFSVADASIQNGPAVSATFLLEQKAATPPAVTPEPPSVLLLLTGLGAVALCSARKSFLRA